MPDADRRAARDAARVCDTVVPSIERDRRPRRLLGAQRRPTSAPTRRSSRCSTRMPPDQQAGLAQLLDVARRPGLRRRVAALARAGASLNLSLASRDAAVGIGALVA